MLKHMRDIRPDTTWEEAAAACSEEPEWGALDSEEEKRALFGEFIEKLKVRQRQRHTHDMAGDVFGRGREKKQVSDGERENEQGIVGEGFTEDDRAGDVLEGARRDVQLAAGWVGRWWCHRLSAEGRQAACVKLPRLRPQCCVLAVGAGGRAL
jgi:hypothetical protein